MLLWRENPFYKKEILLHRIPTNNHQKAIKKIKETYKDFFLPLCDYSSNFENLHQNKIKTKKLTSNT